MRRLESDSPTVPNPSRGSSVGQSGGLIIRRSGVRVPTPVLPELARRVPTIQATYGKPIKAGHPVPIRPFPALPEVLRATRGATRVCVVAPAPEDNPDLAAVVEAWPDLPEALKAGILAMVKAARS